jgi:hypothetical protein
VVTEDATNSTALTILGTNTQPPGQPEEILGSPGRVIRTQILSGDAVSANRPLTRVGLPGVEPSSQLLFWGPPVDCETPATVYRVRHELSPAARSFKAHALHAAGFDAHIEACEEFWANTVLDPDLMAGLLPGTQSLRVQASGN